MKSAPRFTTTGILDTNVGFVEIPRCWNSRTVVSSLVNYVCGGSAFVTEPEHIKPIPEPVSALRNAVVLRMSEEVDRMCHSVWKDICNTPRIETKDGKVTVEYIVDVTRTDRRGRHLKRPV